MIKNEKIFIPDLIQKLKAVLVILMIFSAIIFFNSCQSDENDIIINPEIGSLPKVFDENKNDYSFSGELKAKFDRFKSKGEIKRWEVGKLNNKITFSLEMKYVLNIFENEFEFEITKTSDSSLNDSKFYYGNIRDYGVIYVAGNGNEYLFHIMRDDDLYRIEWLGEGYHLIEELDRSILSGGD
ncbi:MAG: hypothetical protein M0P71_09205 [Melioribacteraceae bacterium]|nr:hypothetical protein [Melioribacteraceae bacterium]